MAYALTRRDFLSGSSRGFGALVTVGTTGTTMAAEATDVAPHRFSSVRDLTHTLTQDFPTFSGENQLTVTPVARLAEVGWNVNRWTLDEHTGTHLDAPFHKSSGDTADRLPAAALVGPLVVVDIREKATVDPDAELTLDDLKTWERRHGSIPPGAIVAMHSGWDAHVRTSRFRNADRQGRLHFPGFQLEAIEFLLAARGTKGIAVDTLSLDPGRSTEFPVHLRWLGSGHWGLECVAGLGDLPPLGAHVVVGAPKVAGASGGPSRVFALL